MKCEGVLAVTNLGACPGADGEQEKDENRRKTTDYNKKHLRSIVIKKSGWTEGSKGQSAIFCLTTNLESLVPGNKWYPDRYTSVN